MAAAYLAAALAAGLLAVAALRALRPDGWQVANLLAFAANVYTVQRGGRLDSGDLAAQPVNYLTPAPYAFAIWAVIYSSEALLVCWQLAQRKPSAPAARLAALRTASPWWCAANACQVLWCLTFTPRFDSAALLWVSAVALSGIAACLSVAHRAVSVGTDAQSGLLLYAPVTLHFGWTTAAMLVNWNGYIARCTDAPAAKLVALVLSLGGATALGLSVALLRRSALYGATVAWALVAVGVQARRSPGLAQDLGKMAETLGNLECVLGACVLAVSLCARSEHLLGTGNRAVA